MPETKSARLETPVGPAPVIRELSPAPAETAKNISAPVPSSPELSHKASAASLKTKPPTPIKSPLLRGISSSSFKDAERFQSEPAPIREEVIKTPPPLIRSLSPQGIARQPSFESAENLFKPVKIISQIRLPKRETSRGLAIPGFSDLSSSQEFGGSGPRLFSRSVSPMEDKAEKDDAATDTDNVRQLAQFFKGPSFRSNTIIFDHMSILATSPAIPVEKINTDKFEVSEITGYGKLNPVSEEEQHLFFDESMYLCIHNFEGLSGKKKTEVIFWSGAKVSESATEDAQLFARKVARDNDARLV